MILTIFGYPKTGKTLLFNLLTHKEEKISKFAASAAGEFHKAVVDVPDPRLDRLAAHLKLPAVHAKIEFLDAGALSFGEVKHSSVIDLLRRADGLAHVARGFTDPEILHPKQTVDPGRDIKAMEEELLATDYIAVETRLHKLENELKKHKPKELLEEQALLERLKRHLEEGHPLRTLALPEAEEAPVRGFQFLTRKPLLHLINADENSLPRYAGLAGPRGERCRTLIFAGKLERELLELTEAERLEFQKEFGLENYSYIRDSFIRTSYELLNLISFFTVGKEETRAWTIEQAASCHLAAGKVHSDMQKGFIRAEVLSWRDFESAGGFHQAKEKGLSRLEGKAHCIKDGDIIHFRFGT